MASSILAVDFSPDDNLLAVGTGDGRKIQKVKLLSTQTGKLIREIDVGSNNVSSLAFQNNGKILASPSKNPDNVINLWSVETGELVRQINIASFNLTSYHSFSG